MSTASFLSNTPPSSLRLVSWNLFYEDGATLEDIHLLIRMTRPDILLMQESRLFTDDMTKTLGGYYSRMVPPGRVHGTACWSRFPFIKPPQLQMLPPGLIVQRFAQILHFEMALGQFSIANVHLSHGQLLNRRQLHLIKEHLTTRAVIIGDFNQVGPAMLRHFTDVGPREHTHRMLNHVPLRLDRCLIRGFTMQTSHALPRFGSDHRPILVTLTPEHVGPSLNYTRHSTLLPKEALNTILKRSFLTSKNIALSLPKRINISKKQSYLSKIRK